MAFFQADFESTVAGNDGGGYLNPSKIPDGKSSRFLILSDEPLTGYELWFTTPEGKQTPRRTADEPDAALIAELESSIPATLTVRDGKPSIKPFAAFFVYDYETNAVRLFSATQKKLLQDLYRKTCDPDFQPINSWDVSILRTGQLKDTKYNVDMKPTKAKGPLLTEIQAAWSAAQTKGYSLEALLRNGSPFGAPAA